jgi:hypothetical protein
MLNNKRTSFIYTGDDEDTVLVYQSDSDTLNMADIETGCATAAKELAFSAPQEPDYASRLRGGSVRQKNLETLLPLESVLYVEKGTKQKKEKEKKNSTSGELIAYSCPSLPPSSLSSA